MSNAVGYWRIGTHFLGLVEAACGELVRAGNPNSLVSDEPTTGAELEEATKWSDHNIGVPVLFNFFHGIELLLKGFISLERPEMDGHRLTELLSEFETAHPQTAVGALIRKYTTELDPQSPLGGFFVTNDMSVDDWYQALRYPESRKGRAYDHSALRYGGADAVAFWRALGQAASGLCRESVSLARSLGQA